MKTVKLTTDQAKLFVETYPSNMTFSEVIEFQMSVGEDFEETDINMITLLAYMVKFITAGQYRKLVDKTKEDEE